MDMKLSPHVSIGALALPVGHSGACLCGAPAAATAEVRDPDGFSLGSHPMVVALLIPLCTTCERKLRTGDTLSIR